MNEEIDEATALRAVEILKSPQTTYKSTAEADNDIAILGKVLDATPPSVLRATILSNLGLIQLARFSLTSVLDDLNAAVEYLWKALTDQPGHVSHPALSAAIPNLISALHTRAEVTNNWDDLDQAILWGRHTVVTLPSGLPHRAAALASLSSALRIRHELSGYEGDLTEAIDLGRQAAADLPPDHPRLGSVMSNLGTALLTAGMISESIDTYTVACAKFQATGNQSGEARALNNLGGALVQAGRNDEAATAFRAAHDKFAAQGDTSGAERAIKNLEVVLTSPGSAAYARLPDRDPRATNQDSKEV
jgi:tetratricopeptide (TPR) repeat protein